MLVVCLFSVLAYLSFALYEYELKRLKARAETTLEIYKEVILLNLNSRFNYADELLTAVASNDEAADFEEAAKRIMENPACVFVQYLDSDRVKQVYPMNDAQKGLLGKQIMDLDYAYTLARLTKELVVEGPVAYGDKMIFLSILPIVEQNENGKNVFAGEAVVALDSNYVMSTINLGALTDSDYEYELWRIHPLDGSKDTMAASSEAVDFTYAVEIELKLPTIWTLSIIPKGGWYSSELAWTLTISTVAITVGFACLLYCFRKNRSYRKLALSTSLIDPETGMLNRTSLMKTLDAWVAKGEPFGLIYVGIQNYNCMTQLCTLEQKKEILDHIVSCLKQYIRNEHVLARIGESNFVLLVKEANSNELTNLSKGLAIELILKMNIENEKMFLTTDCTICQFPKDSTVPAELLQSALRKFYEKKH